MVKAVEVVCFLTNRLWGIPFLFQEEGLRKGGEPKYAHLSMELHVFIEVFAPVPEAYLRMAHAMEEVKKFLFPVSELFSVLWTICASSVRNCPLTCSRVYYSTLCLIDQKIKKKNLYRR